MIPNLSTLPPVWGLSHKSGDKGRPDEPDRRRSAAYEWFNILVWLERAAPDDLLLKRAIAAVHEDHPESQPRDHPELDIGQVQAGWLRPESVLTSEEIARFSLPQWLEALEASRERDRGGWSGISHVDGFLEQTARAASDHLEWGLSFTRSLIESGQLDQAGWRRILTAWGDRPFNPAEWQKVLGVLDHPGLLARQTSGVMQVVVGRATQKDPKATGPVIRSSLKLAAKLLPLAEELPFSILSEEVDWLLQAINHPGGQLAQFLTQVIGELLGPGAQRGSGVPPPCKRLIDALVNGTGKASAMGRVVLASQAHYFLWIDPSWTKANLLPLFDWERSAGQAVQAWHGFLIWGRPRAALREELTESAVQLASHLQELGSKRKHYGTFIARAAFSLPDDPLSKAWFEAFLTNANDDDRAQFARELDRLLESLRPEQKVEIWGDWLNHYLERRVRFPPTPGGQEITALMGWTFNLPGQLADLVERLEALQGGGASVDRLLRRLQKGDLAGSDPNLLARLVLALLNHCSKIEPWELSQLHFVAKRLIAEGARETLIRQIIEKYLEYGGVEHQELVDLLEGRDGIRPSD